MPNESVVNSENRAPSTSPRRIHSPPSSQYVELSKIGSGAYGLVMKGRNTKTGEVIALKRMVVRLSDGGIPQSILREIGLLRRMGDLEHPNIVRMVEVFTHLLPCNELIISLVFEYCSCDLADRCPLNDAQIRMFCRDILNGLVHLSSLQVVHRDIKPQNILLGLDGRLKLSDFGLARLYTSASLSPLVVTLWYRAPEVLLQCSYGTPVDVWSFACIMAELYTLEPLFPGDSEIDQLKKIISTIGVPPAYDWPIDSHLSLGSFAGLNVTSLSLKLGNVNPIAVDLLKKTLAFNPHCRSSARELLFHPFFANT
ncbi:cyclin dependent kinase 6 [Trichuris trichiura]|uniref:cyclin-dependent kinase n=1 Tax=Trichuris trichiura TaxID=36087 RepID=A0A077ZJ78_TRITR|nr:cyclin dependent kinase 6 [Trichuris trichiura]